ncbi:MAG: branched-chain amino acid ABC transporter permease [Anaerolineaceae bacterium]|nr:branched-chain amino acid ABC transporter permease [Anaerolineaceae bacterium]
MVNKTKRILIAVGTLVVLAILPLFFRTSNYIMNILILCLIWSVMAASWDLILGYANVFSFGHMSFLIIGGYTSGLLAEYVGLSPWLGYIAGGLAAALIGFLIGIPCLRLQGMYLAIVTFSLQFVLPTLIVYAGPGKFENFSTGGSWGLERIPSPSLFGYVFSRQELVPWYYLSLAFFVLFISIIYIIIKSPVGLAFVALRDAEPQAKSLGIDEYKYKLLVFAISAFIAGATGAYYAHYFGLISPASMSLDIFLIVLIMVLFGGLGVFPGAAIGAFIITIMNEVLRPSLEWRLVILGAIVILTMMFMPKGMMDIFAALKRLVWRTNKREQKIPTSID